MRGLIFAFVFALVFTLGSCASHVPPNLSAPAAQAWQLTQAIKTIDLLRDTAINANAQMLLSDATTRKVVQWHETALDAIHVKPHGWAEVVWVSLDELHRGLTPEENARLGPYIALAGAVLKGVLS